jgi:hypothetical protein
MDLKPVKSLPHAYSRCFTIMNYWPSNSPHVSLVQTSETYGNLVLVYVQTRTILLLLLCPMALEELAEKIGISADAVALSFSIKPSK